MQVPKFRCTDKLYVQLTYFHCIAFKIKNQPFASNVLTAASMAPQPAAAATARKISGSLPPPRPHNRCLLPDRARASTRPPRPRCGTLPPRPPRPRRGTLPPPRPQGWFPSPDRARASTRPPRLRRGPCPPPTSVRGRRRFRVGCTRKYRARRPTCTNGIPPRCGSSSSPPASSSVCRQCGG